LIDPPKTCLAIGGVSINPQMMSLRGGADIVVATPGRLLDLLDHNALRLTAVETLVLDEADRLLALGFEEEVAKVLERMPVRRQTLLFSATFPPAVQQMAERVLRDPIRINLDSGTIPGTASIVHRAIEVDADRRTMLLRHLLSHHDWSHVLVFVATKYGADHVAMKLDRAGIPVASLHGELSQGARTQALADFKNRRIRVLVATDVAARGIDIDALPAVVNYDLPRSPIDYVHRVGRTGRAGESGVAISFVTAETDAHFRVIERKNRIAIEREQIAGFEPQIVEVPKLDPNGGVKGKRKSKKDKLREAAGGSPSQGRAATVVRDPKQQPVIEAKTGPMFPYTPTERQKRR
jgi:superfamily II DNA/RNA helicase